MLAIPIDEYVPDAVRRDVAATAARLCETGGRVRVCRVPAEDLQPIFEKIAERYPAPFRPTLCGIPVNFGMGETIDVIAVLDDGTLAAADRAGREQEV